MNKISLLAACLLLTVASTQDHINPAFLNEPQATNGTESYFFSPHGLGRTPEVSMALDKIQGQVKVRKTSCNISAITYILDNFNIGIVYNPSKQITNIPKADLVEVKGGRFEITYKFNYTKIENRNNITGYAFGTQSLIQDQSSPTQSPTTRSSASVKAFFAGACPQPKAWNTLNSHRTKCS